ncbi:MAG: hypothetical protein WBM86_21255 [Waterburya sp.]
MQDLSQKHYALTNAAQLSLFNVPQFVGNLEADYVETFQRDLQNKITVFGDRIGKKV